VEVSAKKFHSLLHTMLSDEFLKNWLDLGQVVSGAGKMIMPAGDGNRQHALCRADINEGFIVQVRPFF
jgi:hypothetical protein